MSKPSPILDENEQWHADQRRQAQELVLSGKKSAWDVHLENSFIPMNAEIKIDWDELFERLERAHA
jgi:hypothetical protein